MKYLLFFLFCYCTTQAQECKLTPKDVTGKWQLVATTAGFGEKGVEYLNSTDFVTFTATTFTRTKEGKVLKSGSYTIAKGSVAHDGGTCLLKLGKKTYQVIGFDTDGFLILHDAADDVEVSYYKKVE